MTAPRIVAIVLVRNEDRFLHRAVTNVAAFCDEILIADHGSHDGTWEVAQELARIHPHVRATRIRDPRESNEMIAPFAGTQTWIFGVDGDEIYDPAGLARFRQQLMAGRFDAWWVVFGNVLNCTELDPARDLARGHLAPPCRSMTKLYNFRMLRELDPTAPQRLHSHKGRDIFHEGFHALLRHDLYKETTWDDADFRCLHACFLPRSSGETGTDGARENVSEGLQLRRWFKRVASAAIGSKTASDYKRDKYMRGPLVTVKASPFFP